MAGFSKRPRTVRKALDILLALDFVAVMATALVEEAPHEYLGVSLLALMVAHVVVNRGFFMRLAKGRYTPLRIVQLVVVAGLFVCFIGQLASALVLSKHAFAFLPALPGAAWARSAHMLLSYWGFVFAFAHAGLQARLHLPKAAQVLIVAVALAGVFAFVELNIPSYLFGQVMFASADFEAPLALLFAEYASSAVLVFTCFHYLRRALLSASRINATRP